MFLLKYDIDPIVSGMKINLNDLRQISKSTSNPNKFTKEFTTMRNKKIILIAEGRLVNLGAATGHPASVMDLSFANQALATQWIKDNHINLDNKVYTLPKSVDQKIAATKLKLMGGQLEILTEDQIAYLDSWEFGTS